MKFNKRNRISQEHGLTLIEILAAITITSFITLILFSVLMNGHHAYQTQNEENEHLINISFLLKELTREVRKADNVKVALDSNGNHSLLIGDLQLFEWDPTTKLINKNGVPFAKQIDEFIVQYLNGTVTIQIRSNEKVNRTVIVVRGEL